MAIPGETLLPVVRALGDLSTDGVFLYYQGPLPKLEYANACLREIFDISHATFADQVDFYVNHVIPEDRSHLARNLERLINDAKAENIAFHLKRHDEGIKHVTGSFYIISENYILGFIRDDSLAKDHENYLIHYGGRKDTLLEVILHTMSEQLNISRNLIESVENVMNDDKQSAEITDAINSLRTSTQQCLELVSDFVEEEHLVSQNVFPKSNRFNVVEKLNAIVHQFKKSYPEVQFNLYHPETDVYIENDDIKFLQVLNNLISNAIKFSPYDKAVDIIVESSDVDCSVTVKDQGIGIPPHLQPKVFQRNSPARRPGVRGELSVGAGLYIVKAIAALMGARLTFKSEEGVGTRFTFWLPRESSMQH